MIARPKNVGDLFFKPKSPSRIYRIHRIKGAIVWYLGSHYGANPPKGILRVTRVEEFKLWVKVEIKHP